MKPRTFAATRKRTISGPTHFPSRGRTSDRPLKRIVSSRRRSSGVFAMATNVLIAFYSTYGHVHRMALAVAKGAESVPDVTVRLRRIAELEEARKALSAQDAYVRAQQAQADIPVVTHDDLRWA